MKAILHTHYGSPDLLELREVDKPIPKANEVLIAIHATTVSTGDCNVRNFTFVTKSMRPIAKLMFGIGKPWKERILGTELAGEVEGAGQDVTRFKTGDRVVASTGMAGGGHAQYACLPEAHFHDLRHEGGSPLLEAGWPVHYVQHVLGHASLQQTGTYLNATLRGLHESMRNLDESRPACKPLANKPALGLRPIRKQAPARNRNSFLH